MPGLVATKSPAQAIPQLWCGLLDEAAVSVDWSPSGSRLAAASASCSGRGRDTSLARMAALSVIFMLTTDSSLP